jgi:(2R)-3-sulfolactate dehydrogenase (NADP+)
VPRLTLVEIHDLTCRALTASKTSARNADSVAVSIAAAEADGIPSHGLLRVPTYCAHARAGKVDGFAEPRFAQAAPAVIDVDANNGFAHPAIDLGFEHLVPMTRAQGVAMLGVRNSYNAGVMGLHVGKLANAGLVGLAFANAPAVIAPWGGRKPLFGTNPIAFAAPRASNAPIIVDLASSVVARGEVLLRAQRGDPIPEGWGFDAQGRPTTDPDAVLAGGSMVPAGGHKGAAIALLVEILAATLTGACHSFDAGSLTSDDGVPAGIGQLIIAIDPDRFGGSAFQQRLERLCATIVSEPNVRLPGSRRFSNRRKAEREGVDVSDTLHAAVSNLGDAKAAV